MKDEVYNVLSIDSTGKDFRISFILGDFEKTEKDKIIEEWGSLLSQTIKALSKTISEQGFSDEVIEMELLNSVNKYMIDINEPPLRPGENDQSF